MLDMKKVFSLGIFVLCLICQLPKVEGQPLLEVDLTDRYLVQNDSVPFFVLGDAAWSLIVEVSKEDADFYLESRKQQGFNMILVNLIEKFYASNPPGNFYGALPFTGKAFVTPNDTYFDHVDYVIRSAAQRGIVVLLAPLYLGYSCGNQGWCAEVEVATLADMRQWGQFVGDRYKNFDNIIWIIGGDVDPTRVRAKVQEFVAGVRESDNRHLFTAHNEPESMAVDPWVGESWLNLNNVYSYSSTLYANAKTAFEFSPRTPFFLLESAYENEQGSTPQQLRAQIYWTNLSGACGHIFGNRPIWGFSYFDAGWKSALNSSGALSMKYAQKLFNSRYWYRLVPDFDHSVLVSGYGTWGQTNYAASALASDGSSFIAYLPSSRPITFDATKVSGDSVKCWWYETSTAEATLIGTYEQGMLTFSPPLAGDWVFVADDASIGFPSPGHLPTSVRRATWTDIKNGFRRN